VSKGGCGGISRIPVHPQVRSKSNGVAYGKIEASIPVDDNKNIENHTPNSKGIREISSRFRLLEEIIESEETEETIEPPNDGTRDAVTLRGEDEVDEVRWEDTQDVQLEVCPTKVVLSQFPKILYHHSLFQVTCNN